MKVIITGVIIALLFSGCEKSEVSQLDLKGTLTGKIYTLTEFNKAAQDNDNITILLDGSDPVLSATTDSLGNYELESIPSGTYNVIISKEGYGEIQIQGFQIVGGNEPLHLDLSIRHNSTTTIRNLSLEIPYSNELILKVTMDHNYDLAEIYGPLPSVRYFIHTDPNPSGTHYLQTATLLFDGVSGSEMSLYTHVYQDLFPSGTKIYVIAYGNNYFDSYYYNILEDKYYYTGLGIPSNIVSIDVPSF